MSCDCEGEESCVMWPPAHGDMYPESAHLGPFGSWSAHPLFLSCNVLSSEQLQLLVGGPADVTHPVHLQPRATTKTRCMHVWQNVCVCVCARTCRAMLVRVVN